MVSPKLFMSYRRSDAIDAVRALYFQLRLRFGISQVFMDVSSIHPGDVWPQRLRDALDRASVVLVIVGPTWLKVADQYGRRRLDLETDWVRLEVQTALEKGKSVITLLVGGVGALPPAEALPSVLGRLVEHQHLVLNEATWEDGVEKLTSVLVERGFRLVDPSVAYPIPAKTHVLPLSESELVGALKTLPSWEPVETSIPRDYPKSRLELRRGLRFGKFKDAIAFLQLLVDPLNELEHHPRIENQWRTVFIHFTTWDVGNRITAVDIKAAQIVDQVYADFVASLRNSGKG